MKFVIRKGHYYVALAGSLHSYTTKLRHARIYNSREAADADRCPDNETIEGVTLCKPKE